MGHAIEFGLLDWVAVGCLTYLFWRVSRVLRSQQPPGKGKSLLGSAARQEAEQAALNAKLVADALEREVNKALGWLRLYAIPLNNVRRLVWMNRNDYQIDTANPAVRDEALAAYKEGRCRGHLFAAFVAGEPIPDGQRLVFVETISAGKVIWFALVAPVHYVQSQAGA